MIALIWKFILSQEVKIIKMRKYFLVLTLMFFITAAQAQNDIVVDPNASARALVGNFNTIKVSSGIDIYLSQSDKISAAVSATDASSKEGIKTVVENGVLSIYYDGDKGWSKKNKKLRAYISFVDLKKIDAAGACDVAIVGLLTTESLDLKMSGACDFNGAVKVNTLNINLSGASDIRVSGTANTVNIISSGASDVKGFSLITDVCTVKVSGASDVNITVNKELTANATGASDVNYKGSAVIKDVYTSGASSVAKTN